jgi:YHS domain-containing protein
MKACTLCGVALVIACAAACGGFAQAADATREQTLCPVMGREIDKDLYVDYEGKRVYLCCQSCVETFKNDPEKYMQKLKDQGIALADAHAADHEHAEFNAAALVEPMGITTLSLLAVTACLGFFRKKSPRILLAWHKRLAVITIISAACHTTLVFLSH